MKNQITFKNPFPLRRLAPALAGLLLLGVAAAPGQAQVLQPSTAPYGFSYSDWSAKWWQWTLAQSTDQTNFVSGPIAGPVQFLAGAPSSDTETRNITIPAGTALFFPVLSTYADNSGCPTFTSNTVSELQAEADGNWSYTTETTCTIDGVAVPGLDNPQTSSYFTEATPFSYTIAQNDSVLYSTTYGLSCIPGGTTIGPAVADGVYLMLAPLAPGSHTIHFAGIVGPANAPFLDLDLTYNIIVLNTNGVYPAATAPYGASYAAWASQWWQWTLSQSTDQTNFVSGPISGPVQFLAGVPSSDTETRQVSVPAGTALFFPVLSTYADNSGCPTFTDFTEPELQAEADGNWGLATETTCTIDGVAVGGLDNPQTSSYFTQATPFSYTTALNDSVLQSPAYGESCIPGGTTIGPAVADGVYLMLAPLAPGNHTINLVGVVGPTNAPYLAVKLTYQVTVLPPTGTCPPAATLYGFDYADWAAKWWQWTLSQSTDQTNFVSGPIAGPVQFLAGSPASDTETRSVQVPAGVALFFPILSTYADNSGCPTFTSNTVAQLQAEADGNWSYVTEATCTIDGVAVAGLDNPQTTSYFTEATPFSYTTALSDSILYTPAYDLTCIPGGTTIGPAVADGVYLMLAPLAPGKHTLHFTGIVGPTNAPFLDVDLTYQIVTVPISLSISAHGGWVTLSWPQTDTAYGVETTGDLSSAIWTPVTAVPLAANGSLLVTVPVTGGSQYFRLHAQ